MKMKQPMVKKRCGDMQVGDLLYHFDEEGDPERIRAIRNVYRATASGDRYRDPGMIYLITDSWTMKVHVNSKRMIPCN